MSMLQTVLANLFAPSRTRAPGDQPAVPTGLRGFLAHDAALCTGCGTCAHVCAPAAIAVTRENEHTLAWTWGSGSCSFCGLCEIWCPTHAITMKDEVAGAALNGRQVGLRDEIALIPCPRCGRPHVPLPASVQSEMLGGALSGTALAEKDLCEDCRRRMTSERIRDGFLGPKVCGTPAIEEAKP